VAGGPGQIEIRDGDVYLDGRIQQKTLNQLREVRILVHDDQYRSPRANRWLPAQSNSRWQPTSAGYVAQAAPKPGSTVDWLDYTQWTCWPHGSPDVDRTHAVPILDHDPYNQSLPRGNLHTVPDIMLVCRLQISGAGPCILRLSCRGDVFEWELSAATRSCRLVWNGNCAAETTRPSRPPPWTVEMAVCDHRVLATLDRTSIFEFDYDASPIDRAATDLRRLSIGTTGARVQFDAPQVFRDIYYLGPGNAVRWQAPQPLGPDQWFVLGDNVPLSLDSRFWSSIDGQTIVGPVR
jgi:signal peptidase I